MNSNEVTRSEAMLSFVDAVAVNFLRFFFIGYQF